MWNGLEAEDVKYKKMYEIGFVSKIQRRSQTQNSNEQRADINEFSCGNPKR